MIRLHWQARTVINNVLPFGCCSAVCMLFFLLSIPLIHLIARATIENKLVQFSFFISLLSCWNRANAKARTHENAHSVRFSRTTHAYVIWKSKLDHDINKRNQLWFIDLCEQYVSTNTACTEWVEFVHRMVALLLCLLVLFFRLLKYKISRREKKFIVTNAVNKHTHKVSRIYDTLFILVATLQLTRALFVKYFDQRLFSNLIDSGQLYF